MRTAALSAIVFAVFPVTIRYGRAFQPDLLALGLLVAALRCWDEHEYGGKRAWLVGGLVCMAMAVATKITTAYSFIPLICVIVRMKRLKMVLLLAITLVPALLWYGYAATVVTAKDGSRAAADSGMIWLQVLIPGAGWRVEILVVVVMFLVRSFTPIGLLLAVVGLLGSQKSERLWWVWGGAALAMLVALAAKLHHEYYWLAMAPVVAVGVGKALDRLRSWGVAPSIGMGVAFLIFAFVQTKSTWRTPSDWEGILEAAQVVRMHVPAGDWLVASEALLYEADRRGCRLELTRPASRRAAGEWGGALATGEPIELVEFYRTRGARFVADLGPLDAGRLALHEAIRRRYNVLVDRPGILLAALNSPQDRPDGTR